MRRAAALAAASVLLPLVVLGGVAGRAAADPITGDNCAGATGSVNGTDATNFTRDDPLVVHDGEQVIVKGAIPPAFAATNPTSVTTVKISAIDGLLSFSGDDNESAGAEYNGSIDVDDYFDVGVGLYRVEVVNRSTNGEWECEFVGYVKLDGGSLSKPAGLVALAAVLLGAAGVVFVKGRKPREPGWIDGGLDTAAQIAREEAWQEAGRDHPDAIQFDERAQHGWLPPTPLKANERVMWAGKVRRRGSAGAGFAWGLLLGVGIGLLGWQDARWTVNLGSVVLLPLLVAAVSCAFAWFGWGYRIRDVVVLPPGTAVATDGDGARPEGQLSFDDSPGPDDDPLADTGNGEVVDAAEPAKVAETDSPESAAAPEPSTPPAD